MQWGSILGVCPSFTRTLVSALEHVIVAEPGARGKCISKK